VSDNTEEVLQKRYSHVCTSEKRSHSVPISGHQSCSSRKTCCFDFEQKDVFQNYYLVTWVAASGTYAAGFNTQRQHKLAICVEEPVGDNTSGINCSDVGLR
jgi:hypothetical protein